MLLPPGTIGTDCGILCPPQQTGLCLLTHTHRVTLTHTNHSYHTQAGKTVPKPILLTHTYTFYNFSYYDPLSYSETNLRKRHTTGGVAEVGKSLEPCSSISLHNKNKDWEEASSRARSPAEDDPLRRLLRHSRLRAPSRGTSGSKPGRC